MQQHNRYGVYALGSEFARGCAYGWLVERFHFVTGIPHATGNFPEVLRRHGALRLDPGKQVRLAWDVVPTDFEDVPEAAGHQYRDGRPFAFEDEIGGHGGAVQHTADRVATGAAGRKPLRDALRKSA